MTAGNPCRGFDVVTRPVWSRAGPADTVASVLSRASDAPTPTITPDEVVAPTTEGGDHDRFAHICRKEDVARSYVTGEAIEALCGKKWVPSRDPEKYPVCPACKDALGRIRNAGDN